MARERKRKVALPRLKLLLAAIVLFASCDSTVYHRFAPVESNGWHAGDTLSFLYGGNGVVNAGVALAVQLRYAAEYKYKNMYARVETLSADSCVLSVDTVCCAMYDDDGRRMGSTAGAMYQNGSEKHLLPASCADTLLFKVSHIMDDEVLRGIFDVGIELTAVRD